MAHFRVIYDTCVLVPAPLRDFLLRVAEAGLVRASMSEDILDELERVLREKFEVPPDRATRLRAAIERTFGDSVVIRPRYADIPPSGLPDLDDEHVLAVARSVSAQGIVTFNQRDFPKGVLAAHDVAILHPDDFGLDLIDLFPVRVSRIIEQQAATLRRPRRTYEEVLDALARSIPATVAHLRDL